MTKPAGPGRDRGQSLVEFALILPLIALLLFIVFDFGRAVYAWSAVSNAARDGARLAIVDQGETDGVSNAAREAAEQATALGIDPADPGQVDVQYRSADLAAACPARAIGCVAQVQVQYQFVALTPVIGSIVGPITLSSITQIPIESTYPR